jgi:hypothetical protein
MWIAGNLRGGEDRNATARTRIDLPPSAPPHLPKSSKITFSALLPVILARIPGNALIQHFRGWLHSYMAKLGREPHPHAPDDLIVSQFLSCGEAHQLEKLLYDLMAERKEPGHSYAWFVTVALQRLHGISPQQLKQRRTELRLVKQRPPEEQASVEGIQQQILNTAQEKRMHFHR